MKLFNWGVKTDPKGLKKVQTLPVQQLSSVNLPPTNLLNRTKKRKSPKRERKLSLLRSSPPRPSRGRGGRGRRAVSGSQQSASSSDLRSPARRAPRVPGLNLSSSSVSPAAAAASPSADTPGRRRARRRRNLLRCRNRNRGCTENVTFTTEESRNRHERYTCRAVSQVMFCWNLKDFVFSVINKRFFDIDKLIIPRILTSNGLSLITPPWVLTRQSAESWTVLPSSRGPAPDRDTRGRSTTFPSPEVVELLHHFQ